jgi:hypothetical protein
LKFSQNFWEDELSMFKVQLNIILPSVPKSSKRSRSFRNLVCISVLHHTCCMSRPSHPPWCDHPNSIWLRTNHDVCQFAVFFSLLSLSPSWGPAVNPNVMFSDAFILCFFLGVSCPHSLDLFCGQCRSDVECSAVPMLCDTTWKLRSSPSNLKQNLSPQNSRSEYKDLRNSSEDFK